MFAISILIIVVFITPISLYISSPNSFMWRMSSLTPSFSWSWLWHIIMPSVIVHITTDCNLWMVIFSSDPISLTVTHYISTTSIPTITLSIWVIIVFHMPIIIISTASSIWFLPITISGTTSCSTTSTFTRYTNWLNSSILKTCSSITSFSSAVFSYIIMPSIIVHIIIDNFILITAHFLDSI